MGTMRVLVTGGSGFIGTNLVQRLIDRGDAVVNLDWNPPLDKAHTPHWQRCDLMDEAGLQSAFDTFKPTHVVHLAARTDTDENTDLNAYVQNHEGTRRLLNTVKRTMGIDRVIITSTQFVCEAGYQPKHDQDYKPFTLYGESKRLTEVATREAGLTCCWTIIRPTTIWGPFSLRYRDVMFKVMKKGLYFHPGKKKVIRSYGYVGNVVWQIEQMLIVEHARVNGRVLYVGDQPFDLRTWVEAVSKRLTGKPVRYVPNALVRMLALGGDVLKAIGIGFPITSGRYRSMTSDYITPMDRTIDALGPAPFTMEQGIDATIRWYENGSEAIAHPPLKAVATVQQGR